MTRKKKPRAKKEPVMRITSSRKKHIEQLAEALAAVAPSTSPGKSFCVKHIVEEKGLKNCWKKQPNKKADIAFLLENVMRQYPRKPKALVLAIVEGGVQWMARKGQQVTKDQLNAIVEPMKKLGFSVRYEFKRINIPEPSRVCVPSQDLISLFSRLEFHEALKDDITEMFRDGHFNEAVRKALERFEKRIQDTIDEHKTIGQSLMSKAFNKSSPLLRINANMTGNDLSEQEGFMHLTMGAMSGVRNLYSHGDVAQMGAMDAIERLAFVSLLFKRIDKIIDKTG